MGRLEHGHGEGLPQAAFTVDAKRVASENRSSQRRLAIEGENLSLLLSIKAAFPGVQEQFPFVKGLGFFGSRTKGTSRDGSSGAPSDIDLCVFFNRSEEPVNPRDSLLDGENKITYAKAVAWDKTHGFIAVRNRLEEVNTDIEFDFHEIDISEVATDELLERYTNGIDGRDEDMPVRFLMGIGDGLFENRRYILEKLKELPGDRGEEVFRRIIQKLRDFEDREDETPYPETIAEAMDYFQNEI